VAVQHSAVAFHPPASPTAPVVLACAGSGIAPFRGFLQDRALQAAEQGVTPGPALLFFGCDAPDSDFLYRDELAAWERDGVVSVRPAFSHAPVDGVRYVQDRIWADRAEVAGLFRAGATVYVCGDGRRMAPGVHEICVRIYCEVTGANETDGLTWLDAMQREHSRYIPDVFV
jgi:cytochrome P450/NADPH-cytochrome P450 reductase